MPQAPRKVNPALYSTIYVDFGVFNRDLDAYDSLDFLRRIFTLNHNLPTNIILITIDMGVQIKRDKIMNTHTIKSNACKHYESSHT